MAVPNSRQIVFGSTVVPQEAYYVPSTLETAESGVVHGTPSVLKYRADGTDIYRVNGDARIDVEADQGASGWTSMIGNGFWELLDDATVWTGNRWENMNVAWDGQLQIGHTAQLFLPVLAYIQFLYLKNTGDKMAELSLDASSSFHIYIPPGASVAMHFKAGTMISSNLYVLASDPGLPLEDTTTIEYVAAK